MRFSISLALALLCSCVGAAGSNGKDGKDGADGAGCVVVDGPGDGDHTVTCGADSVVVHDGDAGSDGQDGAGCVVVDGPGAGEHTVTCGADSVVVHDGNDAGEGEGEAPCVVVEGSVVVNNTIERDELLNVCEIHGSLTIIQFLESPVALPRLAVVDGTMTVDAPDVALPALALVEGDLTVGAVNVDLSSLQHVAGKLKITMERRATALSLPALAHAGEIEIVGNAAAADFALASIAMPSLESVDGSVEIGGFLNLTSLDLTSLASVGAVIGNTALNLGFLNVTRLTLPALTTVEFLQVVRNPSLTTLEMPVLVDLFAGNATITGNPLLTTCVGDSIVGVGDCVQ